MYDCVIYICMVILAAVQHQQQHARQAIPSSSASLVPPGGSQISSSPTVVSSSNSNMRSTPTTMMNDTALYQRGNVGGVSSATTGPSLTCHTAVSRQQQMTAVIMASAIFGRKPAFPPQHGGRSVFSLTGALPPTSGGEPSTAAAVTDRVGVGGAIAPTTSSSCFSNEVTGLVTRKHYIYK